MTISPGTECLYGARIERDDKTGREKIIGGMLCRVIATEEDDAWCQSLNTRERFTAKASKLTPNKTEGS